MRIVMRCCLQNSMVYVYLFESVAMVLIGVGVSL